MSKCSHNRDVLDAYMLGIGGLAELDREHTRQCRACGEALAEAEDLRKLLLQYSTESARRADRVLESVPRLPARPAGRWFGRVSPWLAAAAAVVLIVLAPGWFGNPPDPAPVQPVISGAGLAYLRQVQSDAGRDAMTTYLSQTQTLFLSLLYGTTDCEEGNVEVRAEKQMARELLRRKKLLEPELSQPDRGDVRPVFDELELLLLEVAAGDDCISRDQFNRWKQTVETRHTMQRLQLLQMKGRI